MHVLADIILLDDDTCFAICSCTWHSHKEESEDRALDDHEQHRVESLFDDDAISNFEGGI